MNTILIIWIICYLINVTYGIHITLEFRDLTLSILFCIFIFSIAGPIGTIILGIMDGDNIVILKRKK